MQSAEVFRLHHGQHAQSCWLPCCFFCSYVVQCFGHLVTIAQLQLLNYSCCCIRSGPAQPSIMTRQDLCPWSWSGTTSLSHIQVWPLMQTRICLRCCRQLICLKCNYRENKCYMAHIRHRFSSFSRDGCLVSYSKKICSSSEDLQYSRKPLSRFWAMFQHYCLIINCHVYAAAAAHCTYEPLAMAS